MGASYLFLPITNLKPPQQHHTALQQPHKMLGATRSLNAAVGRASRSPRHPIATTRQRNSRGSVHRMQAAQQPQAATSTTPSHAELLAATQQLVALAKQDASQEALDAQADAVKQLAAQAGLHVVNPRLNNGTFRGFTLTGRTAQRFKSVITLGVLSFNSYKPLEQKIRMMDSDTGGVLKGEYGGNLHAYVVTAPFELVEADEVGEASGEAKPLGIRGKHVVIGEYKQATDNPQRLAIFFRKTRMEPVADSPEELQRWLDLLLPHNPEMDAQTGVLEVDLPANSPEGWLDHVLMMPEYQLLYGNYGSKTLLQRV